MNLLSRPFLIGTSVAVALAGVGGYVMKEEHRPPLFELFAFPTRGGSSYFIRTPADKRILINGGSNADVVQQITRILPFYSRRIDAVIATDTQGKNVTGLVDVIDRYGVDTLYVPAHTLRSIGLASTTDPIFETLLSEARAKNVNVHELSAGSSVPFDTDVDATVLFPADPQRFAYSKASAPELVFQVIHKNTKILILGNATPKIQKYIASSTPDLLHSTMLATSGTATPENMNASFINDVHPEYLLYSKADKASNRVVSSNSKKKPVPDPFTYMDPRKKINMKGSDTVHFISDGISIHLHQTI